MREQTEENDDDNLIELEAVTDSYESSNDDAIPVVTSIELRHRSAEIGEANIPGYEDNDPQNKASAENVTSTGVSVSIRSQPDELRDANVEDMIRNNKFYDRLKAKNWKHGEDKTGVMMRKTYKECDIQFLDQKRFPTKEKGKYNTPTKNVVMISIKDFEEVPIHHTKLKHEVDII